MKLPLAKSLKTESFADSLGILAEVGLDQALEQGLLRDIPIISSLFSLIKTYGGVRDALEFEKVVLFLRGLEGISLQKRKKFVDEELNTTGKENKFNKTVMLYLQRADDMEKPIFMSKIIKAHILGYMDQRVAFRICGMIDRCFLTDIELLRSFITGPQKNEVEAESLHAAGFISQCGFEGGDTSGKRPAGVRYCLNDYGEQFVKYVLND